MINTLRISRSKSIKELSLDCRRINVFIGEPNTGKSNILESLGLLSFLYYARFGYQARQFVRLERTSNLFYDEAMDQTDEIQCNATSLKIEYRQGTFEGQCTDGEFQLSKIRGDHNGIQPTDSGDIERLSPFKFYRFRVREQYLRHESDFLLPPSGDNLLSLLLANRQLMSVVNQPFLSMELRLGLRPQENKMEVVKSFEDIIISYPYSLTSDTLQRLTFHVAAIRSNKDSVLVLKEPEAHSFPSHTKYLAEQIALDENNNQYFIATHNPYFLLPLVGKAPKDDIAVQIVYYEDYQTKTRELSQDALLELAEIDVFSNLETYLEGN